jgi:large repetitive protein
MRYYYTLFLTLLTAAISNLSGQVTFTADKVEGCGVLTVNFNASPLAAIHKLVWDFGNGRTSTELSPIFTYSKPGNYTVKLTVNDSSAAIVKSNYIRVRQMPDPRFDISDSVNSGPYIYNLVAAHQPVDTFTYTYNWTFSDDSTSIGPVVVHQFDSTGTYMARLKVTDDFGCTDSFPHVIRASSKIIVPNVFTPNDDKINDLLEVQTNGKSRYLFQVYSSSGILVFKLESVYIRWGGENLSGEKLNQGIYYYTIESLDTANPNHQAGFIYLIY